MRDKYFQIILFLLLFHTFGYSQQIETGSIGNGYVPIQVAGCGSDVNFKVRVQGPISANTVLKATLPLGTNYVSLVQPTNGIVANQIGQDVNFTIVNALSSTQTLENETHL